MFKSFTIKRGVNNVLFRIGGKAYETPIFQVQRNIIPFSDADFEAVREYENTDTLSIFFGVIEDFFGNLFREIYEPEAGVFIGTGPGAGLLNNPATPDDYTTMDRLNDLNAELSPIFGYPDWLNLPLKDWILYEMQKENERWLQIQEGDIYENVANELKDFAVRYSTKEAHTSKIKIVFDSDVNSDAIKEQLTEKFLFFDTLEDGAEYRKYYNPLLYFDPKNKEEGATDIVLDKKYQITYDSYFSFEILADNTIDTSIFETEKQTNLEKINKFFTAQVNKGVLNRPDFRGKYLFPNDYPLFTELPDLDVSNSGNVSIGLSYTEPSPVLPKKQATKSNEEPETPSPVLPKKQAKPKAETLNPLSFLLLLGLIFLFLVFQKASE